MAFVVRISPGADSRRDFVHRIATAARSQRCLLADEKTSGERVRSVTLLRARDTPRFAPPSRALFAALERRENTASKPPSFARTPSARARTHAQTDMGGLIRKSPADQATDGGAKKARIGSFVNLSHGAGKGHVLDNGARATLSRCPRRALAPLATPGPSPRSLPPPLGRSTIRPAPDPPTARARGASPRARLATAVPRVVRTPA